MELAAGDLSQQGLMNLEARKVCGFRSSSNYVPAHIFASDAEAATLRARVPSGSLSHLSGNRFAAPEESSASHLPSHVLHAHNVQPPAALRPLVLLNCVKETLLLDFLEDLGNFCFGA
jgi:hypothetical protein